MLRNHGELESIKESILSVVDECADDQYIATDPYIDEDEIKPMNTAVEICYFNEVANLIKNEIVENGCDHILEAKSKKRWSTKISYSSHKSVE